MTQAEQAYRLHYDDGLTWREVGEVMGLSRVHAKNAGAYWRKRERILQQQKDRYHNDLKYRARTLEKCKAYRQSERGRSTRRAHYDRNRERLQAQARAWLAKHKERVNARRRERYATDAEYRAAVRERVARYQANNEELIAERRRQKYATDDAFRAARLAYGREWYHHKGGADKQRAYRAARKAHTREMMRRWQERRRAHLQEYRRRYRFHHRPRLMMKRSVWEFGPEWGPVHRALNDLRAKLREEPDGQRTRDDCE